MKTLTIDEAADRLAGLLEKELKGLPAREIKQRSEIAHTELDRQFIILMDKRSRYGRKRQQRKA